MKERFEGLSGAPILLEALQRQDIVRNDMALATALAGAGELIEFAPGADLVTQADSDNSVWFLLSGEANVLIHDRFFAGRSAGTCIGEMAAIEPSAPRSATVRAKTTVVALKVEEPAFRSCLDAHPIAYRALAQLIAHRLRQRSSLVRPPNPQPILFIGCSTEGLSIANEVQAGLKHDAMEAVVWTNGVFGPSGTAFDSLSQLADRADFAAFVVSPDDKVISRSVDELAPRDNVIFELGLFMGRLSRERVFLIKEHHTDVKIPSDLLGLTPITYVTTPGGASAAALGPVCHELRKSIDAQGVR